MKIYLFLLAVLMSFCSLSYQFLIVKIITPYIQNEILCQSLSLGFFLLAMGLGSYQAPRLYKNSLFLGKLVYVEYLIAIVVLFMSFLIYSLQLTLQVFTSASELWNLPLIKLLPFQLFILILGFLSGLETPLIFYLAQAKNIKISFNVLLAGAYFGAVLSSFVTNFLFNSFWSPSYSLIVVAVLNGLIGMGLIKLNFIKTKSMVIATTIYLTLIPLAGFAEKNNRLFEQFFLKAFYYDFKIDNFSFYNFKQHLQFSNALNDVQRLHTPYQIIDILPAQPRFAEYLNSDWSLFLDHQPQFSQSSALLYHESMVFGALNLNQSRPIKILILGGGDGLVVKELLKFDFIQKIDLVELDSKMIDLANSNEMFVWLNQKSLLNPLVTIIIEDAYKYIRTTSQKYDAVFIDFPFPVNYELSRLYSIEFYKPLLNLLNPDAFVVLDLPIRYSATEDLAPQLTIPRTLHASGLSNQFLFGPLNPFLFATKKDLDLKFNYSQLKTEVTSRTLMNLIEVNEFNVQEIKKDGPINSIYKPIIFR